MSFPLTPGAEGLRARLFHIIFESDTPGAKAFDIALIVAILLSVAVILLGSVEIYAERYGHIFFYIEWANGLFKEFLRRSGCDCNYPHLASAADAWRARAGDGADFAGVAHLPHFATDGVCGGRQATAGCA